jgi:hypothetical protein
MLPTALESIAADARARFRDLVRADNQRVLFPHLLAAQEEVSAFLQVLGLGMLQDFADLRAEQAMAVREPCPVCNDRMEALKRKAWVHVTVLGSITVLDPVVYCRSCHVTERPAQAWLGTAKEHWSLPVQEAVVDLVTDESAGKAVAIMG